MTMRSMGNVVAKTGNYVVTTNNYADGGIMVEVLPKGADQTLANYGNVRRTKVASGHSRYVWSLVSGQNGIQETEDAAIRAAARAIWRLRPTQTQTLTRNPLFL